MQWVTLWAVVLLSLASVSQSAETAAMTGGCSSAVYIAAPYNGQVVFGSTIGASSYAGYQCGLNTTSTSGTAFYVVSPTVGNQLNVTTCFANTNYATAIAVYTGTTCDNLQCAPSTTTACASSAYSDANSVSIIATQETYWIMVTGVGGAEGQFEMSFTETFDGQDPLSGCTTAISVAGPFTTPLTIVGSLSQPSNGQPCSQFINSTVAGNWIQIFPTHGAYVTATTCTQYAGTVMDTSMAVLAGPSCTQLSCLFVSDDSCVTAASTLSTIVFEAVEESYYIYVTSGNGMYGTYEIEISEEVYATTSSATPQPSASRSPSSSSAPQASHTPTPRPSRTPTPAPSPIASGNGHSCTQAIYLPGSGSYPGFNLANGNYETDMCGMTTESRTAWFVIEPPLGYTAHVSTCSSGTHFDTVMAAYSSCSSTACQIYNDDAPHCDQSSLQSSLDFYVAHPKYYIAVAGYTDDEEDSFELSVSYEANGTPYPTESSGTGTSCTNAVYLPGSGFYPGFANVEGNYGNDYCGLSTSSRTQWFYITPPAYTTVTVTTCSDQTDFDTVVAVYTACSFTNCQVSGDDDGDCSIDSLLTTIQFYATQDLYYIVVAGYEDDHGVIDIGISYD